uniref:Uncharacterized protein n=1 Tax=Panagrolaimus sp. PS1159 TaxID=55785 RepID=A0AC35F382_9BILA
MDKHITATTCKNENGDKCVKLCKRDHFCEALKYESRNYDFDSTKQIFEGSDFVIHDFQDRGSDFEIHDFQDRGILRKWIVIFPLIDNRSKCYEYSWAKGVKKYECKGCLAKKKRVSAELFQNKNGTKYVKLGPQKHICELRKYNPHKFTAEEFVEAPNFEIIKFEENGISKQRLFIFTNSEKTKCYEFYWRNVGKHFACGACEGKDKYTAAKLEERNDGTKYIRLLSSLHVCEIKDYIPDKYSLDETKRIVEKSNFEIFDYQRNNISKSMLVIFCPTNI